MTDMASWLRIRFVASRIAILAYIAHENCVDNSNNNAMAHCYQFRKSIGNRYDTRNRLMWLHCHCHCLAIVVDLFVSIAYKYDLIIVHAKLDCRTKTEKRISIFWESKTTKTGLPKQIILCLTNDVAKVIENLMVNTKSISNF